MGQDFHAMLRSLVCSGFPLLLDSQKNQRTLTLQVTNALGLQWTQSRKILKLLLVYQVTNFSCHPNPGCGNQDRPTLNTLNFLFCFCQHSFCAPDTIRNHLSFDNPSIDYLFRLEIKLHPIVQILKKNCFRKSHIRGQPHSQKGRELSTMQDQLFSGSSGFPKFCVPLPVSASSVFMFEKPLGYQHSSSTQLFNSCPKLRIHLLHVSETSSCEPSFWTHYL